MRTDNKWKRLNLTRKHSLNFKIKPICLQLCMSSNCFLCRSDANIECETHKIATFKAELIETSSLPCVRLPKSKAALSNHSKRSKLLFIKRFIDRQSSSFDKILPVYALLLYRSRFSLGKFEIIIKWQYFAEEYMPLSETTRFFSVACGLT